MDKLKKLNKIQKGFFKKILTHSAWCPQDIRTEFAGFQSQSHLHNKSFQGETAGRVQCDDLKLLCGSYDDSRSEM